ncbi:MAG: hypothetical protein DCF16_18675 [Alphaproteobacteria bacterium]|nr:MAG: hypothetical protein DCF16_18675 [Alphaproteobacteria bacterium]
MATRLRASLVFFAGLALALFVSVAAAQAPDTAEQIQPASALPSPFSLVDGATPLVATGEISRESEIFRVAVQYRRTGFLQNDILRTGLVNSDRVIVPRGSAVFAAPFGGFTAPDTNGRAVAWGYRSAWCAVVDENSDPRGYCMLRPYRGSETLLGYMPQDGTPFAPRLSEMYLPTPGSAADVLEDNAARAAFPPMELVASFDRWRRDAIGLHLALRVGDQLTRFRSVELPTDESGAVTLHLGDATIRVARGTNGRTAIVSH